MGPGTSARVQPATFVPEDLQSGVYSVIQTNRFYAHSESFLIAIATEKNEDIKKLAQEKYNENKKKNIL